MKTTTLQQEIKETSLTAFTENLMRWNEKENERSMPWKGEKDPYRIWLSEIILQQTRVDQGWMYYENFIRLFPDVRSLATAPEEKIFKAWEGLGYYSRCKNLIATARIISNDHNNIFPKDYESIIALKGVGTYTAAAIASFAFNQPYAVVDGNVFRVLSRVFGITAPIDSTDGKKIFATLATALLPKNKSAAFNQAIMDFGATICKPAPVCASCIFKKDCFAFNNKSISQLPVKSKKTAVRKRWFNYVVFEKEGMVAIQQRSKKDIWQNLYEFYLIESKNVTPEEELSHRLSKEVGRQLKALHLSTMEQKLTHQQLHIQYFLCNPPRTFQLEGMQWVPKTDLQHFAFPRSLKMFLQKFLA